MTNEKAIMCLEDMKIKVPIPKAAKQARENNEALDVAIKALQSAQPKRGKWIKISPANIYECSECGKSVMTSDICAYDFCHGCVAKMESEVTE